MCNSHPSNSIRRDIPAYICIPSKASEEDEQDQDDTSIGSIWSFEGLEHPFANPEESTQDTVVTQETVIRFRSGKLRAQSLPPTTLTWKGKGSHSSTTPGRTPVDAASPTLDRPPQVPRRRLSIQTASSCPSLPPVGFPEFTATAMAIAT